MQTIRELTQKGDPMLRIQLPDFLIQRLQLAAKNNKRSRQDQFIKMLSTSMQNENRTHPLIKKLLPQIKELYSA